MVQVRIRRFEKGDEDAYVKVHNEGFSTEEWWGILRKPLTIDDVYKLDYDATFFAETQGRTVGKVDVKIYGDEAHVESLVVLSDFRRIGVGTALLEKAIEFSEARGVKRIQAETPAQNASRFYEKNGFRFAKYAFLVRLQNVENVGSLAEGVTYVSSERDLTYMSRHGIGYEMIAKVKVMIREVTSCS